MLHSLPFSFFFFFNDTATTEIYTLSLHDALPICLLGGHRQQLGELIVANLGLRDQDRSEEHTSELQSPDHLVCRLLLEKKKYRKLEARIGQDNGPIRMIRYVTQ